MRALCLLILISTVACAGKRVEIPPEEPVEIQEEESIHNTIRLLGKYSFASACAVNGRLLSAGHVVEEMNLATWVPYGMA